MSKSRGNTVSPDPFIEKYGSDVFRAYLMFMGPYHEGGDWSDSGITGLARFQKRVWQQLRRSANDAQLDDRLQRQLHTAIRDITHDLEAMRFNTAIARLMSLSNEIGGAGTISAKLRDSFIQLLAPFMPHMAEELWELAGHGESVFLSGWPRFDEALIVANEVTLGITVNGKRRGEVTVPADSDEAAILVASGSVPAVKKHLAGKEIIKEIVIPGRLVNYVVR
jgi:leucyl-tRNA synthetase